MALRNPKGTAGNANAGGSSVVHTVSPLPSRSATRAASSAGRSGAAAGNTASGSTASGTASSGTASASTGTAAGGNPRAVPLVVLNNSTTSGLAREAAQQFETGGWSVTDTGNLSNDIISTCAYYDPADAAAQPAAAALQRQFPAIRRIRPRFAELPSGPVVVVLTGDFTLG